MFTIYGKDPKADFLFAGGCDFVLELGEERKGDRDPPAAAYRYTSD